ncbi:Fumarate respiration sensor kinase protein DcuS [Raoultella ornithinolytica]|nr:Fumarate respiration sensor kinase protein DcuS [Raoultella ornithinolytica]
MAWWWSGFSLSKVDEQIAKGRWDVLLTVLFSALVCGIGTWSLVRGLKRVLLGLEPQEISTQFQQRQAMLHSLKEGVVAVDVEGRVTLINPAASEILLSGPRQRDCPHPAAGGSAGGFADRRADL